MAVRAHARSQVLDPAALMMVMMMMMVMMTSTTTTMMMMMMMMMQVLDPAALPDACRLTAVDYECFGDLLGAPPGPCAAAAKRSSRAHVRAPRAPPPSQQSAQPTSRG